jgi:hypothetical protein
MRRTVIPTKVGIQRAMRKNKELDTGLRRYDACVGAGKP